MTHGIQHAHEVMPVFPGPLTLAYPKWNSRRAPAEVGRSPQLVNLKIKASGRTLVWAARSVRRLPVPSRRSARRERAGLAVRLCFSTPSVRSRFWPVARVDRASAHHSVQHSFAVSVGGVRSGLGDWRQGQDPYRLAFRQRPARPARVDGAQVLLPVVTIAELVDSPLLAGENLRTLGLTAGPGAARISIAGDSVTDLEIAPNTIASLSRLPGEANAVFRPWPLSRLRLARGPQQPPRT